MYRQIYEDKLNRIIPNYIYLDKKNELEIKIKDIEEKIFLEKDKLLKLEEVNKEKLVNKIIQEIKTKGVNRNELIKLIDVIIVFGIKEITKKEKDLYNINNMMYNELYNNGGILISLKPCVKNLS